MRVGLILRSRVSSATLGHFVDRLNKRDVYAPATDGFHHGQMLQVVVRLEERVAGKELHQYTPYAPDITGIRPADAKDDLGRAIMPS